jgi:hypothetical protein
MVGVHMTHRSFSGRESWVFRARAVEQLCGHHAKLVGEVLAPGEQVACMVYSPLRTAGAGPFGLKAQSGSHAVTVTDSRFVITRDPHQPRQPPTARAVAFDDVLSVDLGEALTLGWFVVRFNHQGHADSETVIFSSSGIPHLRAVVGVWRSRAHPGHANGAAAESWKQVWSDTPAFLLTQLAPLVREGERLRAALWGAETWSAPVRRRATCLSTQTLCAVTDDGVLLVRSESPPERGTLVFGVQATCLDRRAVSGASVEVSDVSGFPLPSLVLDLEAGASALHIAAPFGGRSERDLENAIDHLPLTARAR